MRTQRAERYKRWFITNINCSSCLPPTSDLRIVHSKKRDLLSMCASLVCERLLPFPTSQNLSHHVPYHNVRRFQGGCEHSTHRLSRWFAHTKRAGKDLYAILTPGNNVLVLYKASIIDIKKAEALSSNPAQRSTPRSLAMPYLFHTWIVETRLHFHKRGIKIGE